MKEKTMVRLPYFADPENLNVEDEEKPEQLILPSGTTAKQALQMVYRGEIVLTPIPMRAAIESLPYETPKLSASAIVTTDGKSFAKALERALARSENVRNGSPPLLNGPVEPLPAEELKRPFQTFRRF